jgi:hypothetical protein
VGKRRLRLFNREGHEMPVEIAPVFDVLIHG